MSDVYFSQFTSHNCNLTKKFTLSGGQLNVTPVAHMTEGRVLTLSIRSVSEIPDIIRGLSPNQCLGLGVWADGLLNDQGSQKILSSRQSDGKSSIARTKEHFQFIAGYPALMYIDIDGTDLSMEEAHELLTDLDPALASVEMVGCYSSSSLIYDADGNELKGEGSMHFYLLINDGEYMQEYGKLLFNRALLAGHGYPMIDKAGKIHIRTCLDRSVWSPEREVFEATPVLGEGLRSKKNERIVTYPGETILDVEERIDTLQLSLEELQKLRVLSDELVRGAAEQAQDVRTQHMIMLARKRARANDTTVKQELRILGQREQELDEDGRHVVTLTGSDRIMLENGSEVAVADILTDYDSWEGVTLPDPDEPYYGGNERSGVPAKQKAKIFINYNENDMEAPPEVVINSNAHGGILYRLVWDFKSLVAYLQECEIEQLEAVWDDIQHGLLSDVALSAGELDTIGDIFTTRIKDTGKRVEGISTTKREIIKDIRTQAKLKPRYQGKDSKLPLTQTELEQRLQLMNAKYAVVGVAQTAKIAVERWVPYHDYGKWETHFLDKQAVRDLHANDTVCVWGDKGQPEEVSIFELWFKWPGRNTFYSATCVPTPNKLRPYSPEARKHEVIQQAADEYAVYNKWMGYSAEPNRIPHCKLGAVGATGANLDDSGDWDPVDLDLYMLPEDERTVNFHKGFTRLQRAFMGCRRIRQHLREVWAGGHTDTADYLFNWFADLFQHPYRQGSRVLVMKTMQGAGKNIFLDRVCGRILGSHYLSTARSDVIAGRFNWMLEGTVLCYLNEAIFSGDKSVKGQLKSQATDDELTVESKGINQHQVRNFLHQIIGSNESWVAGAEQGDRRHVYLPISDHRVGDAEYFEELAMEIENGGRESFLEFMTRFSITRDLKQAPGVESDQRLEDIMQTEPPMLRFLKALLEEPEDFDMPARWFNNTVTMSKEEIFEKFADFCEEGKIPRNYISRQTFFKYMYDYGMFSQNAKVGKKDGKSRMARLRRIGGKPCFEFEPLPKCRSCFDANMGQKTDWGNTGNTLDTNEETS